MSPSDFVSRGQALVAAGQFQEAVKVCRLGLLAKPSAVDGRVVLGQALLALKRFDEVLAEMRVALELDQGAVAAQILKGEALLRKGDHHGAIETLHAALAVAPGDPKIMQLLGQAEQASRQGPSSVSHPSAAFVAGAGGETKHYPNRSGSAEDGEEDSGGGYTKPTSLSAPASRRRSSQKRAVVPEGTPLPAELAVGDKSGTVEVDPDLDGVEVGDELDFDALAAPPPGKAMRVGGKRGSVRVARDRATKAESNKSASKKAGLPKPDARGRPAPDKKRTKPTPSIELDEAELMETREPHLPPNAARVARVRDAVQMPPGPIDGNSAPPFGVAARSGQAGPYDGDSAARSGQAGPYDGDSAARSGYDGNSAPPFGGAAPRPMPPGLAQAIAAQPHVMQMSPPLPAPPLTPPPLAPGSVPRIAAGMPTMASLPPPPLPWSGDPGAIAARPTIAVVPELPPPPAYANTQAPVWARATVAVQPDPRVGAGAFAMTAPAQATPDPEAFRPMPSVESGSTPMGPGSVSRSLAIGVRRRSKLGIVMWLVIGTVVIGGGVFAGLEIRALRLSKQIAAARDRANDLAKTDTWTGWTAALGSLAKIADASHATENEAALARARALIAFEFLAGIDDAKRAVTELGSQGGLDGDIAGAYLALAQNDAKAAKLAADSALSRASQDPAAQHVAGEAALLAGELKSAVTYLREATSHDPRPLYGIALARALAAGNSWDDALATLERVLKASPDHPAALIERASVLVASGRIATGTLATDVRAQLDKIVAEGVRPLAEQPRGVAPAQVAFADLALARVDQARNDPTSARGDLRAASSVGVEDMRFAEEVVETLFTIGDPHTRAETERANAMWPIDARIRLALAQQSLAAGRANDAEDALAKPSDLSTLPVALALRGQAKLTLNDIEGARADFDAALKKAPDLEAALIGRAQLELAAGDVAEAKKLIEPHVGASGAGVGMTTMYAAILRASGDPAQRAKAKDLLVKIIAGAPNVDSARAQLELARVECELGELAEARAAYDQAIKGGSFDARLESAVLSVDDGKATAGRDALDALLKDTGDPVPPKLVIEVARARMLVGDHPGAVQALEQAGSLSNVVRWKLERERGRLALRRGDFPGAAVALGKALDGCGSDGETFLLAADLAFIDDKRVAVVVERVAKLAPERLKGTPEAQVVQGKLLLAAGKLQDAVDQFGKAAKALEGAKASGLRLASAWFGDAVAKGLIARGQKASARGALEELDLAIKYDPWLYGAYLFRASLLDYEKQPKQALEVAKKGAQIDPENADAWTLVGDLASAVGDRKTLVMAIEKLGAIAPNSDALKELRRKR